MHRKLVFCLLIGGLGCSQHVPDEGPGYFELRTYYAADGKLDELLDRFQHHTLALFEKHGMQNMGYWVPLDNQENQLIYLMGYESRAQRDAAWKAFREDPDWIKVKAESEVRGVLVDSIQSIFLTYTDYSPRLSAGDFGPRVFELRTYFTNEGKLHDLHTRFRNHTMGLFEKHSMTNVAYFEYDQGEDDADNTLLYFITHADTASARLNWEAFGHDPDWQAAYEASHRDGELVNHLTSQFLVPVDFSPLK